MASLKACPAQTALEDLADRALLETDPARQFFHLPELAAKFLRDKRPEAVAQTGDRLADGAYALAIENGYNAYERFQTHEQEWPVIAAALPRLMTSENAQLQTLCDAFTGFLNFSGRWDEWSSLEMQAEGKALAKSDFYNAGWRAYRIGWVSYLRQEPTQALEFTDRAEAHWKKAQAGPREGSSRRSTSRTRASLEQELSCREGRIPAKLGFLYRSVDPENSDVAAALTGLASVEAFSGDYGAAERNYRDALDIAVRIGNREAIASCTGNLSDVALYQGNWPAAEKLAREALELHEGMCHQEGIAADCRRLAVALVRQGRFNEGLPYARRAVAIFTKLKQPDRLVQAQAILNECESPQ